MSAQLYILLVSCDCRTSRLIYSPICRSSELQIGHPQVFDAFASVSRVLFLHSGLRVCVHVYSVHVLYPSFRNAQEVVITRRGKTRPRDKEKRGRKQRAHSLAATDQRDAHRERENERDRRSATALRKMRTSQHATARARVSAADARAAIWMVSLGLTISNVLFNSLDQLKLF